MESRLTFNIRCESADEFGEVQWDFTEAANLAEDSFSFDPEIIRDGRESYGESSSDAKLRLIRTCFRRVRSFFHTCR